MNKSVIGWILLSFFCLPAGWAQTAADRIHIGVRGGANVSWADYSRLKNRDPKSVVNGVGGVFMEFGFGESQFFSIRPEVDFLSRGTKISDDDLDYKLKIKYVDFRLPLIFHFGQPDGIRPYLYAAPVIGFTRGGRITSDEASGSYKTDVSKANASSTYVAGAMGAGVGFPISVGEDKHLRLALEANYQYGFTDTYGKKEKDGEAIALNRPAYLIRGDRKLHSFEITLSLSVPLSIFKRAPKPKPAPVYTPRPVPVVVEEAPAVVEEEKPCYELEEILERIKAGQSVVGKTICAIDMITFEFDKSTIKSESYPYLDQIADLMKNTSLHVVIKGHTDSVGDPDYNLELSRKRAEAVYRYLVEKGVEKERLQYEYYGMTRPLATNTTEEGRLMNRRVEFEITE